MAVASGSPVEAIESSLGALGISDAFDLLISSEEAARGKPHPDVFLAATGKLGLSPESCLVFEDSLVGVQAAAAAGMRCIVRPSSPDLSLDGLAEQVVGDWDEVDPNALR